MFLTKTVSASVRGSKDRNQIKVQSLIVFRNYTMKKQDFTPCICDLLRDLHFTMFLRNTQWPTDMLLPCMYWL